MKRSMMIVISVSIAALVTVMMILVIRIASSVNYQKNVKEASRVEQYRNELEPTAPESGTAAKETADLYESIARWEAEQASEELSRPSENASWNHTYWADADVEDLLYFLCDASGYSFAEMTILKVEQTIDGSSLLFEYECLNQTDEKIYCGSAWTEYLVETTFTVKEQERE